MTKIQFVALLILVLLPVLTINSCKEENNPPVQGTAFSYDNRMCPCCGGLLVEYNSDTLLFPEVPDEITQWEIDYGFPLVISFLYDDLDSSCTYEWKKMTYVELVSHQ
jgi:hypothetical protein